MAPPLLKRLIKLIETLIIDHIGANGEGIPKPPHGGLSVPFTLPGEIVSVVENGNKALLMELKKPSSERVTPPCTYFGECGGCSLQHWQQKAYQLWKTNLVLKILAARGLTCERPSFIQCAPRERRRITLAARATKDGQVVGFHQFHTHNVVSIESCTIAKPEIVAQFAAIRKLAAIFANTSKSFHITVTLCDNGIDLAFFDCSHPDEDQRRKLTSEALKFGFIRVTVNAELIVETQKPTVRFGRVSVEIPSGGFLQATVVSEHAMAELVLEGLNKSKTAADLFCGSGSFTFRMAEKMKVFAVEGDPFALNALERSARRNIEGLKPIQTQHRDLFSRPLSKKELETFDGLIFDPPRAGAEQQTREIAKSNITQLVAVSCNPVTLARDLRILVDGGYKLDRIYLIDQFLWSSHCEVVAHLSKRKLKPDWTL